MGQQPQKNRRYEPRPQEGHSPSTHGPGPGLGPRGVQEEVSGIVGELIPRGPPVGWMGRKAFHRRREGAEQRQERGRLQGESTCPQEGCR